MDTGLAPGLVRLPPKLACSGLHTPWMHTLSGQFTNPQHSVNLDRYPIHRPGSADCRNLVARLRRQLDSRQYCQLPEFLRHPTRREEVGRVLRVLPQAYAADSLRNIYLERSSSPELPADHPRNLLNPASYRMVGAHLLPEDSALKQLYHWPAFRRFVEGITGSGTLYPSADPYQPVNVLCHGEGDRSAWHFDSDNAFTMTLMLQAPDDGGVFEILPNCRSDDDPNIEGLRRLLRDDRTGVETIDREEGALMMFRGCHSAHRVTPVRGSRIRMMGVMVYESAPGVIGDPVVNATVYGV